MISRKDYEAIAAILAEELDANRSEDRGAQAVHSITMGLANYFVSTNTRFDSGTFIAAAEAKPTEEDEPAEADSGGLR